MIEKVLFDVRVACRKPIESPFESLGNFVANNHVINVLAHRV